MLFNCSFQSLRVHNSAARIVFYSGSVWFMSLIFLICSCKRVPDIQQESLYGKWDIVKAIRNNKETPYLRGGYFIFENSGTMTINITGSIEQGPYKLNQKTLRMNDNKDFIIESLQNDSMTIRFTMNPESDFLFQLFKHPDEVR